MGVYESQFEKADSKNTLLAKFNSFLSYICKVTIFFQLCHMVQLWECIIQCTDAFEANTSSHSSHKVDDFSESIAKNRFSNHLIPNRAFLSFSTSRTDAEQAS